jgi:ribonuclease BN (tRNA processing enzyme)
VETPLSVTRLPDGAEVVAATTADQEPLAGQLGYPDAAAMNAEHDPTHLALCLALGLETSPTLQKVAASGDRRPSDDLVAAEEAMVLAAQAFLNCARAEGWA